MEGFFSRAGLGIDVLALSAIVSIPLAAASIVMARYLKNYRVHKSLQIFISVFLFICLCIFEFQVRTIGWQHQAYDSKFRYSLVYPTLIIHVIIAVSTVLIWTITLYSALKSPGSHSVPANHKRMGRWAFVGLIATYLTGIAFYFIAFVY